MVILIGSNTKYVNISTIYYLYPIQESKIMLIKTLSYLILFGIIQNTNSQQRFDDAPQLFFLSDPPPETPRLMASGMISTGMDESNGVFSSDSSEFYFTIHHRLDFSVIVFTKYHDSYWAYPDVAPFSGVYQDADPFIKDGKLFFASTRPTSDENNSGTWNIWFVEKVDNIWTEPKPLLFNSNKNERHPSISENGNLYFYADYESDIITYDFMNTDIYLSKYENGMYLLPEKLSEKINSSFADYTPLIAPDERFIIIASNRPGGNGNSDLYISYKDESDEWGEMKNLGLVINSAENEHSPSLSPDGEYLLFSSNRKITLPRQRNITYSDLKRIILGSGNGFGDIYNIGFKVLP